MGLFESLKVSASGLNAQRRAIQTVATNLANAHTTRTESGGPYLRKRTVLSETPASEGFAAMFSQKLGGNLPGVKAEVVEDTQGLKVVFDPSHPDADESGAVTLPNVSVVEEMVDLLRATRSYEANVTAFNAAKGMALKALEIGNK
jgi:flagellar basal-body rod protein FlgC